MRRRNRGFIALPIMGWAAIGAGAVILALGVAVKVQTARLDSAKAETEAVQAEYEGFKVQVAALGKTAQEAADAAKRRNSVASTKARTDYEANLARVSNYYIGRLSDSGSDPGSGPVPGPGGDTSRPDAVTAELGTCRASHARLQASAAGDALQLWTLQELLRAAGHPVGP